MSATASLRPALGDALTELNRRRSVPLFEYAVIDIGFSGTPRPVEDILNEMSYKGWRLCAVAQRVGNDSNSIRHYFERPIS